MAKQRKSPAKRDPPTATAKKRKSPAKKDPSTATAKKRKSSEPATMDPATDTAAKGRRMPKRRVFSKPALTLDVNPNAPVAVGDGNEEESSSRFIGEPVAAEEALNLWPDRYQQNEKGILQAKAHFRRAEVDDQVYDLGDNAHVQGEPGKEDFICKIVELFEDVNGDRKFSAQWYYRADDTVLGKDCSYLIDNQNIFFSEVKDDNALDCLVKKLDIVLLPLKVEDQVKANLVSKCDFYYDKMYLLPYTSFVSVQSESTTTSSESGSTISSEADTNAIMHGISEVEGQGIERTLLDLYSGCGGMSTGLCLGANSSGVKLVTKWAVDFNEHACESMRLNHPETQIRNEKAENYLTLIKEWKKLIAFYMSQENQGSSSDSMNVEDDEEDEEEDDREGDPNVYEVESILDICYGDPNSSGSSQLHFKIRWKGYDSRHDTWEPKDGLRAPEKLKEFVLMGHKSRILPLPGTVDVICGGPPCQGISGYNRFRKAEAPLEDPKNQQLTVFMDIVSYLKPKFVLMENVVDLFKFANGFLGRYAMGSLVKMGYQTRMGMMAAGAYGLPQFRMRAFVWGALPTEKLPSYPLPTHKVVVRGVIPLEFEPNTVAYEEGSQVNLKTELFLRDAISDLPHVENNEDRDQMPYGAGPENEFQQFIRLRRDEMPGYLNVNSEEVVEHCLYDHRPLCLNDDDYDRVCQIPKEKGGNFRHLDGVRVRADNKVEWHPDVPRVFLSSGKPLVPDYAMSFVKGTSSKPFGRLWWDETVSTVVTRAEPHNQAILHPNQDRVLTIRENARLQGFPDYYRLLGPVKERYMQVGNAVAVPVARALGFTLASALRGLSPKEPVITLPDDYPAMAEVALSPTIDMS